MLRHMKNAGEVGTTLLRGGLKVFRPLAARILPTPFLLVSFTGNIRWGVRQGAYIKGCMTTFSGLHSKVRRDEARPTDGHSAFGQKQDFGTESQ